MRTSPAGVPGTLPGLLAFALTLAVGSPAQAQGQISNARVETRVLAATIEREVQAIASRGGVAWLGYQTAMMPGRRQMCCGDSMVSANDCARIALEPPNEMVILARIENRRLTRLRLVTPGCGIDGGGVQVVWLEKVPPAESVAWLTSVVRAGRASGAPTLETHVVHQAVAALALHPDPLALHRLIAFAREEDRDVKRQALFWLAHRAGQEAVGAISDAIERDPDTEIKKRAVFALSQLPGSEGVPLLVQLARTNKNPAVRKQAMFWLGQTRDPRAVAFFEEILTARP